MSKSVKNAISEIETPITPPAVEEDNFLAAETGQDFGDVEVGGKKWRTLQLFHEDHKTRRKTPIEMGGFGIRVTDEPVPGMGEIWDVPYANGSKDSMSTFTAFTGALVGWSEKYTALKGTMPGDDGAEKSYFQPIPAFVNDDEISAAKRTGALHQNAELRSSSCVDMFFVLKGDPKRNVFRLRLKNHELVAKFAATLNAARALAQKANAPVCAIWFEWKLSDALEVGKAPNTALVNGIELASTTVETSMKATKTEYFGQVDEHGVGHRRGEGEVRTEVVRRPLHDLGRWGPFEVDVDVGELVVGEGGGCERPRCGVDAAWLGCDGNGERHQDAHSDSPMTAS